MSSKINPSRRIVLAAVPAALALSACSLIGPGEPPQIYVLAPDFTPMEGASVSWQLSVARPDAPAFYDNQRIAIMRGGIMDYYANAQWTDETEPLIQRLIVQAFEKSGRIPAVGTERAGLHSDYLLEVEVRNFYANYASDSAPPSAVVELVARLMTPAREVVATLDSRHEAAAAANSIEAAVAAFNTAAAQTIGEIAAWTFTKAGAPVAAPSVPVHRTRRHHS
jgi:cholesterol transport system auxiliary component